MKQFKLKVHTRDFSSEDLVINPKDFPDINARDILEIYHQDGNYSRLLLQFNERCFKEDLSQSTISVEQSVATAFQLRKYDDVIVCPVNSNSVALDSLEITFKDQYLERSDMWRLKTNLEGAGVYLGKKLEFWGIRFQVYEMWAQGERVACGTVTYNTKIVFRSCTNLIYLFIQMSSEMWDMDIHGYLYFEKAINGFLADLFNEWKTKDTSHEVTIVLFSRTFYEAQTIDEFPKHMHSCLQRDYKGRFYEDFYRVAVQNERYDDWKVILVNLKKLFNSYHKTVLEFHHRPGVVIPKAINSSAAQGNFLEVLNMSLNVFEKHYRDRSFDRTGHLSVVITPGVGIFEVDRELTNITKQRIIDNGVGSDLVCLGEQPLHAVPLFKFHSKISLSDDYSMPHWTNLSFYSYPKSYSSATFIPRIKLPQLRSIKPTKEKQKPTDYREIPSTVKPQHKEELPNLLNAFDYDQYDANVFNYCRPGSHNSRNSSISQKVQSRKRNDTQPSSGQSHLAEQSQPISVPRPPPAPPQTHHRKFSETDIATIQMETSKSLSRSAAMSIPTRRAKENSPLSSSLGIYILDPERMTPKSTFGSFDDNSSPPSRPTVGSVGSPYAYPPIKASKVKPGRALINPFDPSHVTIKLTSYRRRWTHVFPLGPKGIFMQQHHYQAVPQSDSTKDNSEEYSRSIDKSSPEINHASLDARRRKTSSLSTHPFEGVISVEKENKQGIAHSFHFQDLVSLRAKIQTSSSHPPENSTDKYTTLLWGATGEQDWTPSLTTGVDWKSCTVPACLPITTDYFPDKRSIHHDFVVTDYELIPEYMGSDVPDSNSSRPPLLDVFRELVCQRLQQGFQIIVHPHVKEIWMSGTPGLLVSSLRQYHEEYFLSIGRIFHRLMLGDGSITVQYLRPRHPYPTINIKYLYRFMAQHSETYEISSVDFTTEKLENFSWNYMDHYICTRGEGDFILTESLKYSRIRMFILPAINSGTKRIQEGSKYCDVYEDLAPEIENHLLEFFTHFANHLNKIRKGNLNANLNVTTAIRERAGTVGRAAACQRRSGLANTGNLSGAGSSLYRERADSNRLERTRPRNAKTVERMRSESGNGGRGTPPVPTPEISEFKPISSSSLSLDTGTDNYGTIKDGTEDSGSAASTPRRLTTSSPLDDIIDSMKHPQDGINFVQHYNSSFSNMTFVSYDAVCWAIQHIEDIQTVDGACTLFNTLLSEKKIYHISGEQKFIYGYYLYCIGSYNKATSADSEQSYSEVAYHLSRNDSKEKGPSFLQPNISWPRNYTREDGTVENDGKSYSVPLYKTSYTVIPTVNTGSDREEWGHLRYHGNYMPSAAFEMVFQWLVATGSYVTDLVLKGWARRASASGLLLLPMHSDPFAQLFSNQFDPLRGTIFIPLNMECIKENRNHPFSMFSSDTWDYRLFLFQEAIVRRFGFLCCQYSPFVFDTKENTSKHQQYQPQYVHITGHAMIMIPLKLREILNRKLQSDSNKSKLLSVSFKRRYIWERNFFDRLI
ncbi:hypothetical protein CHUAL_005739 [Chamberlinius hualienensis]